MSKTLVVFFLFSMQLVTAQDSTRIYIGLDSVLKILSPTKLSSDFTIKDFDTSLVDWHSYVANGTDSRLNLGNFGSDVYSLELKQPIKLGFVFRSPFSQVYQHLDNVEYHNSLKPITVIDYYNGSNEEQMLALCHTQNILPNWNVGIDYTTISSTGAYFRQRTEHKNAGLSSVFNSSNGRYQLLVNGVLNNSEIQENGGILTDSLFRDNIQPNRQGIPVQLSNAANYADNRGFSVVQSFDLFGDSKSSDSVNAFSKSKVSLLQSVQYEWLWNRFDDSGASDSLFYNRFGLSTDNVGLKEFREIRQWNHSGGILLDAGLEITAKLRYEQTYYEDLVHQESFNSLFVEGGFIDLKFFETRLSADSYFGVAGLNAGNYSLNVYLDILSDTSNWALQGGVTSSRLLPRSEFWIYGNEGFGWRYDPDEVFSNEVNIKISSRVWNVSFEMKGHTIDNFTYFENDITPKQWDETLSYGQLSLRKHFDLGAFNIKLEGFYQIVSDSKGPIRVPTVWTNSGVYYENDLFKKALKLRLGADVSYFSRFKANRYLPINRTFVLQEDQEIGNYPFVDMYLTAQIKRVRVFAKLTHINQSFTGFDYYNLPDYPHFDRMVRIGASWIFIN